MLWVEGLNQLTSWTFPTSHAPRYLREQLEYALGGAEVGQKERDVCGDHPDERHRRKIQSLGDHLRADQHIRAPLGERLRARLMRQARLRRVAVPAQHARRREL